MTHFHQLLHASHGSTVSPHSITGGEQTFKTWAWRCVSDSNFSNKQEAHSSQLTFQDLKLLCSSDGILILNDSIPLSKVPRVQQNVSVQLTVLLWCVMIPGYPTLSSSHLASFLLAENSLLPEHKWLRKHTLFDQIVPPKGGRFASRLYINALGTGSGQ